MKKLHRLSAVLRSTSRIVKTAVCVILTSSFAVQAQGNSYPERPIKLVVPFAVGGATDAVARLLGSEISQSLGQAVVIENRAGAAGLVGVEYVAKSSPDGYTVCVCPTGPQVLAPHLREMPFDPTADLLPVVHVHNVPNIILARSNLPADGIQELIALAKQQPGEISFGTPGLGGPQQIAGEMLKGLADIELVHVPYRGESPAFNDLAGGQIDLAIGTIAVSEPLISAGKIKALAVTGTQRSPALPDVPTVAESGFPDYEAFTFVGLNVPHGTPPSVINKLNEAVNIALEKPEFRTTLLSMNVEPAGGSPEDYANFLSREYEKTGKVVRTAGIRLE